VSTGLNVPCGFRNVPPCGRRNKKSRQGVSRYSIMTTKSTTTNKWVSITIYGWALIVGMLFLQLAVCDARAAAQDSLGGHVGVVFPFVTHAGGNTTNIFLNFTMGVPVGVTVKGTGRLAVDFEFVPTVQDSPRLVTVRVDPGVLVKLGHGFTYGTRVAFDVPSSQFGFVPLINKSWPIKSDNGFLKAYFVEADFPILFNRPPGQEATNPFTFAMHFGVGF